MLLSEYFSEILTIVDKYSQSGLVISSEFRNDSRTEKSGIIKGNLEFIDGSKLYFTEYLDLKYGIEKFTYSYHYQNQSNELIFRYDNARHKPAIPFKNHKHLPDESIIVSQPPDMQIILNEILEFIL